MKNVSTETAAVKSAKSETANVAVIGNVQTSKTIAATIGVTPFAVRKFLRSTERFSDGVYTRYAFSESDAQTIINAFNASRNRTVTPIATGDLSVKPKPKPQSANVSTETPKRKTRRVTPE